METFEIKITHPNPLSPVLISSMRKAVNILIRQHNNNVVGIHKQLLKFYPSISLLSFDEKQIILSLTVKEISEKYLNFAVDRLIKSINNMAKISTFNF